MTIGAIGMFIPPPAICLLRFPVRARGNACPGKRMGAKT